MDQGCHLTKKGVNLLAKIVGTTAPLVFTKVTVGNGVPANGDNPALYTDLNHYVMDGQALRREYVGDGVAKVVATVFNNIDNISYSITEAALWATDPDDGEILFNYMLIDETPQSVSGQGATVAILPQLEFISLIGDVASVVIEIDPDNLISWDNMIQYAATKDHTHDTSEIVSGILPTVRGGTSVATVAGTGTQGLVFISGASATAAPPSWRALTSADMPSDLSLDSADKLTTARTIQTNLASTTPTPFDGTQNVTPGVSGILPVANGGTSVATIAGNAGQRKVFASPASATAAAPGFYALGTSDITGLDDTLSSLQGGGGALPSGLLQQISYSQASVTADGWTQGADGLYRKTITSAGITADQHILAAPTVSDTSNTLILYGETSAGAYTLVAGAQPTATCSLNMLIFYARS
ncbi:hypothetical protein AGMMS49992_28580 [Clostridia bacterium]|nr:hypothetical protein AGMMS49992_28580 [Clostridia bacterium]